MTANDLLQAVGLMEDTLILEAEHPRPLRLHAAGKRKKLFVLAACLLLAAGIPLLFFRLTGVPVPGIASSESEGAAELLNDDVTIYYLEPGSSVIQRKTLRLDYTADIIFEQWRAANHLPEDVFLIDFHVDSNGYEFTRSGGTGSSTAGYVVGDSFSLTLTLSDSFLPCLNEQNRDALLQSLVLTMSYQQISFDSVTILSGKQTLLVYQE